MSPDSVEPSTLSAPSRPTPMPSTPPSAPALTEPSIVASTWNVVAASIFAKLCVRIACGSVNTEGPGVGALPPQPATTTAATAKSPAQSAVCVLLVGVMSFIRADTGTYLDWRDGRYVSNEETPSFRSGFLLVSEYGRDWPRWAGDGTP